jgi:hypothetical protein
VTLALDGDDATGRDDARCDLLVRAAGAAHGTIAAPSVVGRPGPLGMVTGAGTADRYKIRGVRRARQIPARSCLCAGEVCLRSRRAVRPSDARLLTPDALRSPYACISLRKPVRFRHSISRCAFLNAPAG